MIFCGDVDRVVDIGCHKYAMLHVIAMCELGQIIVGVFLLCIHKAFLKLK